MGAFCCCPCGEDFEEYGHPNSSVYRHCICIRYFFHQLFTGYTMLSQRIEGRTTNSSGQGITSLSSTGLNTTASENVLSEAFHLVPRPAPYDTDPRYARLQRDGLVSRREKDTSHTQEESQMPRRNSSSSGVENLGPGKKRNGTDSEEECKTGLPEVEKNLSSKLAYGTNYMLTNTEDEDVCPTCLDEYTPENPKIVTKCSHHFHLGCIYEWMERSDNCPLCGKEMEFSENL